MNIELSEKEFRRLLDMVYIGNWILNSTRGDDRFEDYDQLQEKLFSLCPDHGMRALIQRWHGHIFPSQRMRTAAYTRPSLTMRTACFSTSLPRSWRGATLTWSTPTLEDFSELTARMDEYMAEFEKNGLNTINIDL